MIPFARPGWLFLERKRWLLLFLLLCFGLGVIYYDGKDVARITVQTSTISSSDTRMRAGTTGDPNNVTGGDTSYYFRHPEKSLLDIFQNEFPQCQMLTTATTRGKSNQPGNHSSNTIADRWISWLNDTTTDLISSDRARYVPTTKPSKYDHISCFLMKARYNCAMPSPPPLFHRGLYYHSSNNVDEAIHMHQASEYQLIWRHPRLGWDRACNVQELVEAVGGPAGMYPYLSSTPNTDTRRPFQVLLQGNSYLRQVWEAMVCGFRHQMTNLTLLRHGPMTSLAYIKSRSGKLLTRQELGEFWTNQHETAPQDGCHGPSGKSPMADYYWNTANPVHRSKFNSTIMSDDHFSTTSFGNVTVPPSVQKCTDDMAMVEFGHSIQFFFLFHPSRYNEEALLEAYQRLGIHKEANHAPTTTRSVHETSMPQFAVETLVWTGESEAVTRHLTVRGTTLSLERLLPFLKAVQERSIDYFFGANNPWITNPPDNHPCMPGLPDDEASILLYLLLLDRLDEERRQ
jgi:hypothetical protein